MSIVRYLWLSPPAIQGAIRILTPHITGAIDQPGCFFMVKRRRTRRRGQRRGVVSRVNPSSHRMIQTCIPTTRRDHLSDPNPGNKRNEGGQRAKRCVIMQALEHPHDGLRHDERKGKQHEHKWPDATSGSMAFVKTTRGERHQDRRHQH